MKPTLAKKYTERKKHISWPAYVQPKLNGVRCLAIREEDGWKFFSRNEKEFTAVDHLADDLDHYEVGTVLDGELFNPDLTFQQIISGVKRDEPNEMSAKIEYWIYDIVNEYQYAIRLTFLREKGKIKVTPTSVVGNEEEMDEFHREFIRDGFEGTMVRNLHGPYEHKRSNHLQKYKDFIDKEFEIIGTTEGQGKEKGLIVFLCRTKHGREFACRPKGSYELRERWWKERDSFIGEMLTVRYQNLSDEGTPIFPVGIAVRDYE